MNYYRNDLKRYAQDLRKNMTSQEKHLWYDFLRGYRPRFYRQKPVLIYILDFYCPRVKMAVELDGSQHYEESGAVYDAARNQLLQDFGIRTLRFTNRQIEEDFVNVCVCIEQCVLERLN